MNRTFKALGVAAIIILSACSSKDGKPMPDLTFAQISPSVINVASLKVDNEAKSPPSEAFVLSPEVALQNYLERRFKPAGPQGVLRGVIEDAHVTHITKASDYSAARFLDVAGFDEYEIEVRLRLEHLESEYATPHYSNSLRATRIIKISEHASVAEREKRQLEGLENLFKDIDAEVTRIVLGDMKLAI